MALAVSGCRRFAETVQPVAQAHYRMLPQHARTSVAHPLANLFATFALVAMHGARGTDRLVRSEMTAFQPGLGVIEKLLTFRTQPRNRPVMVAAKNADHRGHGQPFARQPRVGQIISHF